MLEARAGIEPAHRGFADRCVTTSPSGQFAYDTKFSRVRLLRDRQLATGYFAVIEKEVDARERA